MGATPWSYFTPFEPNVRAALSKLRQRVFESGEYEGSEMNPATPDDAVLNMEAEGTASILDIFGLSKTPEMGSVCPLPPDRLTSLFGTTQPTHEMVESSRGYYDDLGR